jgi:hypothetical protein
LAPKENNDTFVRITNKEIYVELLAMKESNSKQHNEIIGQQKITNGNVKLGKWMATTALTLFVVLLGLFLEHMIKVGGLK